MSCIINKPHSHVVVVYIKLFWKEPSKEMSHLTDGQQNPNTHCFQLGGQCAETKAKAHAKLWRMWDGL